MSGEEPLVCRTAPNRHRSAGVPAGAAGPLARHARAMGRVPAPSPYEAAPPPAGGMASSGGAVPPSGGSRGRGR
ncbi:MULTISPECIES: hypothetical protein [Streptomyces]|uniref:hypothetical protein n=1 Tax=Streptomyces TaxID=1883 RepID=UPI00131B31B6|nr:hypothetical protein [Streptomyces sp. CFMR 7]